MPRCSYETVGGVRVFIPRCESGANSGGALCTCPPAPKKKEPEPPRAEITTLTATLDELGRKVRELERRVTALELKG